MLFGVAERPPSSSCQPNSARLSQSVRSGSIVCRAWKHPWPQVDRKSFRSELPERPMRRLKPFWPDVEEMEALFRRECRVIRRRGSDFTGTCQGIPRVAEHHGLSAFEFRMIAAIANGLSSSSTLQRRFFYDAAFCARYSAQRFRVASAIRFRRAFGHVMSESAFGRSTIDGMKPRDEACLPTGCFASILA